MSPAELRPLHCLEGIQEEEISGLKEQLRVGSCEELVSLAIAAGEDATRQLAEAVGISEKRAGYLIEQARAVLPPDEIAELEKPLPYDTMYFGARHPSEKQSEKQEDPEEAPDKDVVEGSDPSP